MTVDPGRALDRYPRSFAKSIVPLIEVQPAALAAKTTLRIGRHAGSAVVNFYSNSNSLLTVPSLRHPTL
jgi:hypothetical protein